MMENNLEEKQFEQTNASDLWIRSIMASLERIEEYELIARQGCGNILEYLEIKINDSKNYYSSQVHLKNLDFMITELDILFVKISPRTLKKFNEDFIKEMKILKNAMANPEVLKIIQKIDGRGKKFGGLLENFYMLLNTTLILKSKIIKELSPLLFVEKQEREGGSNFRE